MALFASVRQSWLRRNTVFLATVFGAALVTELVLDVGIDRFWEFNNRGVSHEMARSTCLIKAFVF
jgi:hypothetical protein